MPYSDGHFDKVYAIEATCHSTSLYTVYAEVFRVLKPGGLFAMYEWIMTDHYNPTDPYHKKLKADILVSSAVCSILSELLALQFIYIYISLFAIRQQTTERETHTETHRQTDNSMDKNTPLY